MWRVAGRGVPPNLSDQIDSLRTRELFSDEAGDESPAANLALRLHPAEGHQQITPWRRNGLARQQITKHYTPTQEQLARHGVQDFRVESRLAVGLQPRDLKLTRSEERPASRYKPRAA